MSQATRGDTEVSLTPAEGWHCSHLYYRFDRARLAGLSAAEIQTGREQFAAMLDAQSPAAPARLQISVVSGHKADFGLMLLDADPLKIDAVHQRLRRAAGQRRRADVFVRFDDRSFGIRADGRTIWPAIG